jgi:hypothetical protein
MKEVNLFGIYVAPIVLYLVVASLIFLPVKLVLDRLGADRVIWHRPLFDVSLFVCTVALVTLAVGHNTIWPL